MNDTIAMLLGGAIGIGLVVVWFSVNWWRYKRRMMKEFHRRLKDMDT